MGVMAEFPIVVGEYFSADGDVKGVPDGRGVGGIIQPLP